jgi:hypothetical protein
VLRTEARRVLVGLHGCVAGGGVAVAVPRLVGAKGVGVQARGHAANRNSRAERRRLEEPIAR